MTPPSHPDPFRFPVEAGPLHRTQRLIPSRFPPVQAFETVASADDLDAVMELEGWTNDRIVAHRLNRIPRGLRVHGGANASVVMASFLHGSPEGQRFTSSALGAWYASLDMATAVREVAHGLRREIRRTGWADMVGDFRAYSADLVGGFVDIRGAGADHAGLYHRDSYALSQPFGEAVRTLSLDDAPQVTGIVYDSLRHDGGTNAVCFHPPSVQSVAQGIHIRLTVPREGRIIAERLSA